MLRGCRAPATGRCVEAALVERELARLPGRLTSSSSRPQRLLGILGDEHGDWALVGYSVLATAVALSFAAAGLVIVLLGLVEDSVTALRRR